MEKSVVLSVRLSENELRKLQLLAQVYERSVGELIRAAVGKHVEKLTRTEEFKTRALELKKRNEQTLSELLEVSVPMPSGSKVVRSFPRNISGSNISKFSTPAPTDVALPSFVHVDVGQPVVGSTQLGAAASHKMSKAVPRRSFKLVWKQGDDEWSLEGKGKEVVLVSVAAEQPAFITWKNLITQETDHFQLERSEDGRTLVDIPFSKALMRAEALRNTEDDAERSSMLPMVHTKSKTL